ncbi:hypothetical protein QFZ67_000015 [Streptomyces sp. V1I1]|nr:hypothetical protein [Streptomyces sp. V1I1]
MTLRDTAGGATLPIEHVPESVGRSADGIARDGF